LRIGIIGEIPCVCRTPILPPPWSAWAGFREAELREQFVNGMLAMALSDGVPARETVAELEAFAAALDVDTPALTDLRRLAAIERGGNSTSCPRAERSSGPYFVLVFFARSIASVIRRRASSTSPQPSSFTHLPGSRSL
jgi:hypothetical protein